MDLFPTKYYRGDMKQDLPKIGIVCDVIQSGLNKFHGAGEKYINAVAHGANAMPILLPAFGDGEDITDLESLYDCDAITDFIDGLFLTGSPSNIKPDYYNGDPHSEGTLEDVQRDSLSIDLIKKCREKSIPILAVCRGFQEVNVAFGGSLHQKVHSIKSFFDHRETKTDTREDQYGPAHSINLVEGGKLQDITNESEFLVNSLHSQGIAKLADCLCEEAFSEDGLIEAFSCINYNSWILGVQWHPEWQFATNDNSLKIFAEFGDQVRRAVALRNAK